MKLLPVDSAFPRLDGDHTVARALIYANGTLPSLDGKSLNEEIEVRMLFVKHLLGDDELAPQAPAAIDTLLFSEQFSEQLQPLHAAWLWMARMSTFIAHEDLMLALGAAENALNVMADVTHKKTEDFLALLVTALYNLAHVHHQLSDNARATKELTRAHKLLERLVKKNEKRFTPIMLFATDAATDIIKSKNRQMEMLARCHDLTELYTSQLNESDTSLAAQALNQLIDTLEQEGNIMLEMGNPRDAMRYFSKALRYQKRLSDNMGMRELTLSLGLARSLNRIKQRRAAAEQLLTSLLPLARKLGAAREAVAIENMLNNRSKNTRIMSLLKGLF